MRIILASKSNSRKRVMDSLGIKYEVIPSNFDEKSIRDKDPYSLAIKLSEAKAKSVGDKEENSVVIAGDLFVVFEGKIYEKPENLKEAYDMLKSFSGKKLHILAGLAVYNSKTKKMQSTLKDHKTNFKELSDKEINNYISNYPVCEFSAAFDDEGIRLFAKNAKEILSEPTAVPIDKLKEFLKENEVKI